MDALELELLQHAVDAKPGLDPVVHGFQMNIGGAPIHCQRQKLADEAGRALGGVRGLVERALLGEVFDFLEAEHVGLAPERLRRRGRHRSVGRHRAGIHGHERSPDARPGRRDDLDLAARAGLEVIDDRGPRGVVHRHDQRAADARDRDDQIFPGKPRIDQRAQRSVRLDRVEIEEVDVELQTQGLTQLLLGRVLQADDRLTQRLFPAPLLGERRRELLGGEDPRLDQELAELGLALVALQDREELAPRDDPLGHEDVAERRVALGRGLQLQRPLDALGGHQTLVDQDIAEPPARAVAWCALAKGRRPIRLRGVLQVELGGGSVVPFVPLFISLLREQRACQTATAPNSAIRRREVLRNCLRGVGGSQSLVRFFPLATIRKCEAGRLRQKR